MVYFVVNKYVELMKKVVTNLFFFNTVHLNLTVCLSEGTNFIVVWL